MVSVKTTGITDVGTPEGASDARDTILVTRGGCASEAPNEAAPRSGDNAILFEPSSKKILQRQFVHSRSAMLPQVFHSGDRRHASEWSAMLFVTRVFVAAGLLVASGSVIAQAPLSAG